MAGIKYFFKRLFRKDKTDQRVIVPIVNSKGRYVFYCPGCQVNHIFNTNPSNNLPVHQLKGSLIKPTVRASILSKGSIKNNIPFCHSFISKGKITFLKDCSHSLAGKTVALHPPH
jgi:hypothetical protein